MSPNSEQPGTGPVQIPVVLAAHLHARPAGQVVRTAAGFSATVEISFGGKVAGARSVLGLLALGATAGGTVVVSAIGTDAVAAAGAVAAVLTAAE